MRRSQDQVVRIVQHFRFLLGEIPPQQEYNRLAQAVRENLDMEQIYRILSEQ